MMQKPAESKARIPMRRAKCTMTVAEHIAALEAKCWRGDEITSLTVSGESSPARARHIILTIDMAKEAEMSGYKTVTASEGYEFRIASNHGAGTYRAPEYQQRPQGKLSFAHSSSQTGYLHLTDPTIELVKIAKPKVEVEADVCFEFPWPDEGRKGDFVSVDRDGRWALIRYTAPMPGKREKIQLGLACRRTGEATRRVEP